MGTCICLPSPGEAQTDAWGWLVSQGSLISGSKPVRGLASKHEVNIGSEMKPEVNLWPLHENTHMLSHGPRGGQRTTCGNWF